MEKKSMFEVHRITIEMLYHLHVVRTSLEELGNYFDNNKLRRLSEKVWDMWKDVKDATEEIFPDGEVKCKKGSKEEEKEYFEWLHG